MDTWSVIGALLVGCVSLAIVMFILRLILISLIGNPWSLRDRYRIKSKAKILLEVDKWLQGELGRDEVRIVCDLLRNAFILENVRSGIDLIEQVHSHHIAILGRVLSVSEQRAVHMQVLPVVEDLLTARTDLLKQYFETVSSRRTLERKQKDKGRDTPNWVAGEYERKLDEIIQRLATNRRSLESQIHTLFALIVESDSAADFSYH